MKTCPACGETNAPERQTCGQCGQVLDAAPPAPDMNATFAAGTTVAFPGMAAAALARAEIQRTVPLAKLFATKSRLVVGRGADCDVTLPHPTVSRHHADLERLPDGKLRLTDHSRNGVFVEGKRLEESHVLLEGERVGIGPFLFTLQNGVLFSSDSSRRMRLEARGLERVVPLPGGRKRKLLDNISLVVEPGEFVSLLGPSGSGKSTLMDCLNGRRRATGGRVLANGEDFYRHYDSFRQSLGYVPQKDIVHTDLSVYRALYYTAQLRLPKDTGPSELRHRIEEVLAEMELDRHRQTLVGRLSGGQVKRVSLGAELLAQPSLLYIDEATSGLDAGTEARMMKLFRQLADQGRSILCITHNLENVSLGHLILVLTEGRLAYYGPPDEAPRYFRVDRISDIYDRLAEQEATAWERAFQDSSYHRKYITGRLSGAAAPTVLPTLNLKLPPSASAPEPETAPGVFPPPAAAEPAPAVAPGKTARPYHPPLWHQFHVLTERYAELIWSDRRAFWLLLAQAPVVGLILLLPFIHTPFQEQVPSLRELTPEQHDALVKLRDSLAANQLQPTEGLTPEDLASLDHIPLPLGPGGPTVKAGDMARVVQAAESEQFRRILDVVLTTKGPIIPDEEFPQPKHTYTLLLLLVIVVFWLGCNNAGKEIVKEEAIYARERAVNLGILPYLGSKFLVLGVISAVQVLLLMGLVYGGLYLLHAASPDTFQVPPRIYHLPYLAQYGVLTLLALTGVAVGLVLSACVSSPDRANALLPYVLIPQIILADGFIPVDHGILHVLAVTLSPVYWAYRAVRRGVTTLPESVPAVRHYNDSPLLCCLVLVLEIVVVLALTTWFMRRKDVATR